MTSIVIDLIMNTLNITCTSFMNSKYQKFQFYKVTQYLHKKTTRKYYVQTMCILFTSWHTIFDIKSDLTMSWEMTLNNVYPTFTNLQKNKLNKLLSYTNVKNQKM
jgi:hypothetical protein